MPVKVEDKTNSNSIDEQKKMPPRERWIAQRYGIRQQSGKSKRKARSINELYNLRYTNKFH